MPGVTLQVVGVGEREMEIRWVLNGGYAGRDTAQVQHHVDELASLGVPAPTRVPSLYPLSDHLVSQRDWVQVPHEQTSGEAEWALIIGADMDDVFVVAACDHTDRALEQHGVAWSKQSAPDLLGTVAWRWEAVRHRFDDFSLRAWVTNAGVERLIQDGSPAQLLSPDYWLDALAEAQLALPGTLLMSGTIPMISGVDQFADRWRVELSDGDGHVSRVNYALEQLPPAWD
jgi:2-keto-4-pentenoate hydratase/2-oxohepta-3-ene-1,7-dioic acid hydratase in catechol pathway